MKPISRSKSIRANAAVAVAAVCSTVGLATAHADGQRHRRAFEPHGTWINTVLVWPRGSADAPCGDPPANAARFESFTTFFADGQVIEAGGPAAGPPTVAAATSRSPGLGLWERMGWRSFLQSFRQNYLNAAGVVVRTNVVQNVAELRHGDDPATTGIVEAYHLFGRGTNVITNVQPNGLPVPPGGALAQQVHGCNLATSRPFTLEE